ncbi:GNAT family N-acetyltransferase [Limnoglobus roseus]|uniref:N-acetyltransferase n=1 Tax=Limnoglobus roseus TaxID=2598579 RepID=A0A5C1A8J9_9BACT|nr:GNAT family N-acetyltransferase [Limnoglobus roseus]QEL15659.1 N-acetyltransferase [Limnoglobus roseus]
MAFSKVYCWEPTELGTPVLAAAERLYEGTIAAGERIPWMWIERAAGEKNVRRPTGWMKHLILATAGPNFDDPEALLGYAYGAFIPGFGGYICYVGVSEKARKQGVGSRLFESMFTAFAADATYAGESLPFVIWESHRPTADEGEAAHRLWNARVRAFEKVGGLWVEGLELITPDYDNEDPTASVPLQLFVKPIGDSVASFTAPRLRTIAKELMEKVYHEQPGDYFHDQTLAVMNVVGLKSAQPAALAATLAG